MKFINKYLGIIITIIVIINGVYIFNVIKNKKEVELDEVILKEEKIDKKETFAIMIQNDNGEYISSNSRVFPTEGYRYNETKSGCMDNNGYKIDNSLSYNNETNKVVVRINKEAHCYVYFDVIRGAGTILEGVNNYLSVEKTNDLLGENTLYRYQGTYEEVTNNYICFNTDSKGTCLSDTERYMYRILGITQDNRMKLIKNEAIFLMKFILKKGNSCFCTI